MNTVLIITDNLRTQINGVVTTFKNLERLAALDDHCLVYIDPSDFAHVSAPGYAEVKLSLPLRIGSKIKSINPDYIHIATEGPIGFAAKIWLDKHKWKYNTSYHTKFPEFLNRLYHIPESWSYAYLRWFHKHSGRVLTTTQTMVNELKEHGFRGDIIAWTRGVNRDIFNPGHRQDNNNITLVCVSRISKEKGIEDFCNLHYIGAKKIVVGDGPYRAELEKKYPDIEFVGLKKGTDLAKYYASADVFVFPSRTDTFGIVIIEAMACGTPVAAYPVTGPIDIIEQYQTGFMDESLTVAIDHCLDLEREIVYDNSKKWSWENCWNIFKDNLVKV